MNPDTCLVSELMAFWLQTVLLTCEVQPICGWLVSQLPPSFFPSMDGLHAATNIVLGQGIEIVVGRLLGLGTFTESRRAPGRVMAAQS